MSYEASCPSCGAPVTFRFDRSVVTVCEHCHGAIARKGADLAEYGRTAEPLPTSTVLARGIKGNVGGSRSFEIVGRVQLDHGTGTWDEWYVVFGDGSFAWLAESMGRFHLMQPAAMPPVVPTFPDVRAGRRLELGKMGIFAVDEVREATVMTVEGELPTEEAPGTRRYYADLSGEGGIFATIDYGQTVRAQELFVGKRMTLDELGISRRDLRVAPETAPAASGKALSCTQCGGPLDLKAPDQTQRVGCPWCGSLLDATRRYEVLATVEKIKTKPKLELGATGTLAGVEWTVIGFLVRSTRVEGVRYSWREYLLYEPAAGFRWLLENNGHWSFVEPVAAGELGDYVATVEYQGKIFKHFQSCHATVDQVLGECYWAVTIGEKVTMKDFVHPPRMLSSEESEGEVNWSVCSYLSPAEVAEAFAPKKQLARPAGVAPNQPWPHEADFNAVAAAAVVMVAILFGIFSFLTVTGSKVVHTEHVQIPDRASSGSEEATLFTDSFDVPRSGNVRVSVEAPVDNSWLYLDGALINETTGEFHELDLEVSRYSGYEEGEHWSEGSQRRRKYVGSVSPGRYTLRLAPQWEEGKRIPSYDLEVRSRVPRLPYFLGAGFLIATWPIMLGLARLAFETERWKESDHPIGGSS